MSSPRSSSSIFGGIFLSSSSWSAFLTLSLLRKACMLPFLSPLAFAGANGRLGELLVVEEVLMALGCCRPSVGRSKTSRGSLARLPTPPFVVSLFSFEEVLVLLVFDLVFIGLCSIVLSEGVKSSSLFCFFVGGGAIAKGDLALIEIVDTWSFLQIRSS